VKAELEQMRQALRSLEKARGKLATPTLEALNGAAADLTVAVESLSRVEMGLAARGPHAAGWQAVESELAGLRSEFLHIHALLEGAGKFHQGWARLLCTSEHGTANYTAEGRAGSPVSIDTGKEVMHG
jgi:hypothetical protein